MSPVSVSSIGEYIRQQREQAKISLRQLASAAGVSNPYLSQVERGLRRPSAEILQQIAKGLRISAEALYVQAGILEDRRPDSGVRAAVLADPELTERQKQVLLEIYESFRRETTLNAQASSGTAPEDAAAGAAGPGADPDPTGPGAAGTDGAAPGAAGPAGPAGPGTAGRVSAGRDAAGGGGRNARRTRGTRTGSTSPGSTGKGSTGTGSAPATGQAAGTANGADGQPGGTDQESSGAQALARNAQGPAGAAGQGR